MVEIKNDGASIAGAVELLELEARKLLDPSKGRQALVLILNPKDGPPHIIGIADEGIKGYTPTEIGISDPNYHEAQKIVEEANRRIFPERTHLETMKIVVSTLR